MKKIIKAQAGLFLALFISASWALDLEKIPSTMQEKINTSLSLLRQSGVATQAATAELAARSERLAGEIFKIFDEVFDYKLMSRLSLGPAYSQLDPSQQGRFDAAFEKSLKRNFTEKLRLYRNQNLKIEGGEQKGEKRYLLNALILRGQNGEGGGGGGGGGGDRGGGQGSGGGRKIIFKFYKNATGQWLIYDADLAGISLIQTYRSQFADLLAQEGFEALITKLNELNIQIRRAQ